MATRSQQVDLEQLVKAIVAEAVAQVGGANTATSRRKPAKPVLVGYVVDLNSGREAREYGDLTIQAQMSDGGLIPKMGVRREFLAGLISQLQEAHKALNE